MKFDGSLDYRDVLRTELAARQRRNPAYSLRAFARDIVLSPSRLSEVLSGQQRLSVASAATIARRLAFDPERCSMLTDLVRMERATTQAERARIKRQIVAFQKQEKSYFLLQIDQFESIAKWYHLAILAAAEVRSYQGDLRKIALALDLPLAIANEAAARLVRLGLAKTVEGTITAIKKKTKTPAEVPSTAVRSFHRQMLQKCLDSLDALPVERRFANNSLINVPEARLPEAKEFLMKMRQEFADRFEDHEAADQVFGLSIGFFPILSRK